MKLSVVIPTYNFENYIEECLESVVSQETNFDYEIIIRDDFSQDNTVDIIKKYQKKYDNIFYIPANKNIGFHKSIRLLLDYCRGEYISYIDGDDYWINKNKLQKDVDFLEKNKDYSMVFSGYWFQINEDKSKLNLNYWWGIPKNIKDIVTKDDLLTGNLITSSSRTFRNYENIIKDYFYLFSVTDWPMNYEISKRGNIKFLNYPSFVYRKHNENLSYQFKELSKEEKKIIFDNEKKILLNNL